MRSTRGLQRSSRQVSSVVSSPVTRTFVRQGWVPSQVGGGARPVLIVAAASIAFGCLRFWPGSVTVGQAQRAVGGNDHLHG